MAIVADQYESIIGVDTHVATHTLPLITAATGAVLRTIRFPASPVGWSPADVVDAWCFEPR